MTATRCLSWLFLACTCIALAACEASNSPIAPQSERPQDDGPELTTPEPSTAAASAVFEYEDEVSCCSLTGGPYGRFGFQLNGVGDGFYTLTAQHGSGTCNNPPDDPDNGTLIERSGDALNWSSTMPVGAVLVGSALGTRVYVYAARSWGDSDLRATIDPSTGSPAAITSLEFCYDYALQVSIDLATEWVATVQWDLTESISPSNWELFPGDRATSRIEVSVAPMQTIQGLPTVHGSFTITNRSPLPATVSSITNLITQGIVVPPDCGSSFPFVLQPGESRECSYTREFADASPRTNLISVNTIGTVRGGSARANLVFDGMTTANASVHVVAPDGSQWGPFSDASSFAVERSFDVSMLGAPGAQSFPQQASLLETGQTVSEEVTVECVEPLLVQNLSGSFLRSWSWSFKRTLAQSQVNVIPGQVVNVDGALELAALARESAYELRGSVQVLNPSASRTLELSALEAPQLSALGVRLECVQAVQLQPGESLSCAVRSDRSDTAPAQSALTLRYRTLQFFADGSSAPLGEGELQQVEALSFAPRAREMDHCIELRDDLSGLVTVHCAQELPASLPLSLEIGPYRGCEDVNLFGRAELFAPDAGLRLKSNYQILVHVECSGEPGLAAGN